MMMKLMLLLLYCKAAFAVKHSLNHFFTGSSGIPHFSEFVGFAELDGIQMIYYDGDNKILEPRQDWMKNLLANNPQLLEMYTQQCFAVLPNFFREEIITLKQQFKESGGVSILQLITGCEWDEKTGEVTGFVQYAYNGEGFLELHLKTLEWIALKPEADIMKQRYDADTIIIKNTEIFLSQFCPDLVKMFLNNSKSSLQKTVISPVSLLQKTPSSPVSCHTTGFYPDRAMMFWRKDGEEIHEGVDHREILPNHDGTFQMSADLNVSSVTSEDWGRYDCVFQLSGVKNDHITKLNKSVIRTNRGEKIPGKDGQKPSDMMIPVIAAVFVLVLILITAVGFAVHKKKKDQHPTSSPDNNPEVFERLTPEAM